MSEMGYNPMQNYSPGDYSPIPEGGEKTFYGASEIGAQAVFNPVYRNGMNTFIHDYIDHGSAQYGRKPPVADYGGWDTMGRGVPYGYYGSEATPECGCTKPMNLYGALLNPTFFGWNGVDAWHIVMLLLGIGGTLGALYAFKRFKK